MPQTTQLTTANLLMYPSEKLAKADDGGGIMRGVPLSGAVNELFDPTSEVELVNGGFDARLVYAGVLTNDLAKLYGAYLIVGERPQMPNVSVMLFGAAHYGEYYNKARYRIESYSAPTIESRMTLLGKALAGSKLVQCYQRVGEALPLVGERFCLQSTDHTEYFRIAEVEGVVRTYANHSRNHDFQRLVVTIKTTDLLANDHQGAEYPSEGYANATTKVLETQIADSAQYFGIRPADADALKAATTIKVDSIYEQLVPTTTTDTAWADQYPAGNQMWIPTAATQTLFNGSWGGGNLYLPSSVQPGSVQLAGYTDNAVGQLVNNSGATIEVDYAAGLIRNLQAGRHTIKAVSAARVSNNAYSSIINIDQTNQSTEWSPFLNPKPAPGSVRVSWMTGGQWYDLDDKGDYVLRDSKDKQRGTITRDGSCVFSLPDMPDAGSKIIVMWSPIDYYCNIEGNAPDATVTPKLASDAVVEIYDETDIRPSKPGTVRIAAGTKTATDDGKGNITGDFTGKIDYGTTTITSADIAAAQITLTSERYTDEVIFEKISINSSGTSISGNLGKAVQKGSLMIVLNVVGYKTTSGIIRMPTGRRISHYEWTGFRGRVNEQVPVFETVFSNQNVSSSHNVGSLYKLTDNTLGGLLLDGRPINGSIDYTTGIFSAQLESSGVLLPELNRASGQMTSSSPSMSYVGYRRKTLSSNISYEVDVAAARYVSGAGTTQVTKTLPTGKNIFSALAGCPQPCFAVFNSYRIDVAGTIYYERDGVFYDTINPVNGLGNSIGKIDVFGNITLTIGHGGTIKIVAGVYVVGGMEIKSVFGRTPAAPVLPQSFSIRSRVDGTTAIGQSQADGSIAGALTGNIEETTGFYQVSSTKPIQPEAVRFNVTTQSYIPLPKNLIGIDTVRLRPDGKVPIFRLGNTIVIHNRAKHNLGSAHTAGATVSVGRNDVDFICVKDAKNKHVEATKYEYDLDAGTIKWSTPLDLSAYTQPLTAHTSREELNRITSLDINGTLGLQNQLKRAYAKAGTHVSSALVYGTLQTTWTNPFEQQAWTNVWKNERIGNEILAKLNTADFPLVMTNDGAITQRWLIKFKDGAQFYLIAEHGGLIMESDTTKDLSPINPSTGKPYFTIPKSAFGTSGASIWAAGNCIRFNTTGTNIPAWVVKTIQPSTNRQVGNDRWDVCMRGNTTKTTI